MAVKNIYIKDKQKWFCEDCFEEVCHCCLFEDCDENCDYFGFYDYLDSMILAV